MHKCEETLPQFRLIRENVFRKDICHNSITQPKFFITLLCQVLQQQQQKHHSLKTMLKVIEQTMKVHEKNYVLRKYSPWRVSQLVQSGRISTPVYQLPMQTVSCPSSRFVPTFVRPLNAHPYLAFQVHYFFCCCSADFCCFRD